MTKLFLEHFRNIADGKMFPIRMYMYIGYRGLILGTPHHT